MENNATSLNLASIIEHHARLTPKKEAVVFGDTRINYGTLDSMANRVANALTKMGIGKGDKVALSCPNLPYFPIVYYGILKAGAVVVPLNVLFKPREIKYHLKDSDAKAVFVFEGTDELPMAKMVKEAFDKIDACEDLIVMCAEPSNKSPIEGHKTLTQITFEQSDKYSNALIPHLSVFPLFPMYKESSRYHRVLSEQSQILFGLLKSYLRQCFMSFNWRFV